MPRPQPVLASKIRGFVCRSCLAKLQAKPSTPWLARSFANQNSSKAKETQPEKKAPSEPTFRFFQQTPDGRRIEIQDDEDDFLGLRATKDNGIVKDIDETLETFEQREKELPKGSFMSRLRNLISPLPPEPSSVVPVPSKVEGLTSDELEKYGTNLGEKDELGDDDFTVPSDPKSFKIPLSPYSKIIFPEDNRRHDYKSKIAVLNEHLSRAWGILPDILDKSPKDIIPTRCSRLWRSYVLCRRGLLSAPHDVPRDVWWLLWSVFSSESAWNKDRLAHLKILGEDMYKAGLALPDSETLLYIEALFMGGEQENALRLWESAEDPYDDSSDAFKNYWELGVRMLAKNGQIDRSIQVADILLSSSGQSTDARILLPIIHACLNSSAEHSVQKAWALYVRLRVFLGPDMEMDDYDSVITPLLNANQPDLALAAFVDMMLTGDDFSIGEDSTSQYQQVVGINNLSGVKIGRRELDWESSKSLAKLPKQFNNRYFFGSWIKKLIGDGELELAEKVLDLMNQRGICPDSKHLNGMIGAWLRTGTARGQEMAETTAWRMIRTRIEFVNTRRPSRLSGPVRAVVHFPDKKDHKSVTGITPRANIETFGLLVESYRRHGKHQQLEELYNALDTAQIPISTFFMNQMLSVDTFSHKSNWAWDKYFSFVRERGVRPDYDTYKCLWFLMKKNADPLVTRVNNKTSCRSLFAEMLNYSALLTESGEMPRDLYDTILLSFGLVDDQIGTAIALHALKHHFGTYPTPATARTVVLQLSRAGRKNAVGLRPRRLKLDSVTKGRIDQVSQVLAEFRDQRVEALARQGIVFEEIQGDAKLNESLMLLCDVLGYAAAERNPDEDIMQLTLAAAEEMGVPEFSPWRDYESEQ
ncbi:pentatricopeptide repeat domain-containing protein [Phlyctema vagabunda]|uniref:Pentatricopeptide repeat domain-containing protein n=1 Tax=Phlyctema vagabunda TaxID=108571 RepID=A0ABR4PJM6_9HELO